MDMVKELIRGYGIWLVIGIIAQKAARHIAESQRGTSGAIGGEIFVLPLILMFAMLVNYIRDELRDYEEDEDSEDE